MHVAITLYQQIREEILVWPTNCRLPSPYRVTRRKSNVNTWTI